MRNSGDDESVGHPDGKGSVREGAGSPAGLAYLTEIEPDIRGAAILGPSGEVVECSVPADSGFAEAAAGLAAQVEDAGVEPVDSCHVTTDEAEVFMVREAGFTLVAVSARFVLASLMTYDIRMTLRDLAGGR